MWPFTLGRGGDAGWLNHFWEGSVKQPWDARDAASLPVVHTLLRAVAMRHSRLQTTVATGAPLVELPRRTERWVGVDVPAGSAQAALGLWFEVGRRGEDERRCGKSGG